MATFTFASGGKSGKSGVGKGSTKKYSKYLLDEKDKTRKAEQICQTDVKIIDEITKNIPNRRTFCPAIIGFTIEESKRLDESKFGFIALEYVSHLVHPIKLENVAYSLVKHTDIKTGKIDIHVTIAQQDLSTGEHFTAFLAKRDMPRLKLFSDMMQIRHELDDPRDPLRQRLDSFAGHIQSRKEIIENLNRTLTKLHTDGAINNRDDVLEYLESKGFEITRASDKTISIKSPEHKKAIRLKGAIYDKLLEPFVDAARRARAESRSRSETSAERYEELRQSLHARNKKRSEFFNIRNIERRSQNNEIRTPKAYALPICGSIFITHSRRTGRARAGETVKRVKFVDDLLAFNEQTGVWMWSNFNAPCVRDLGNELQVFGRSGFKPAIAIAAAKGWENVVITCSKNDVQHVIEACRIFKIECRIIVDGEEMTAEEVKALGGYFHPVEAPAIEAEEYDGSHFENFNALKC